MLMRIVVVACFLASANANVVGDDGARSGTGEEALRPFAGKWEAHWIRGEGIERIPIEGSFSVDGHAFKSETLTIVYRSREWGTITVDRVCEGDIAVDLVGQGSWETDLVSKTGGLLSRERWRMTDGGTFERATRIPPKARKERPKGFTPESTGGASTIIIEYRRPGEARTPGVAEPSVNCDGNVEG